MASILETAEDVEVLRARFESAELAPGESLVHSHDAGRSLHFVESGQLTVYAVEDGITVRLRRATTGALLGTASFFQRQSDGSLVTIVADTPARVLSLSRAAFDELVDTEPRVALALQQYAVETLADRYAAGLAQLERTLSEET